MAHVPLEMHTKIYNKNLELINRNKCVLTSSKNIEDLYIFEHFPIFMGCTNAPMENDLFSDMSWSINKDNGFIQLKNLIPLDILYSTAHGSGMIGNIWANHHKEFCNFIKKFNITSVLEIGGSHGILANEYHKSKFIPWTIIDPNPVISNDKINIIKGFFDKDFNYEIEFNTIIHSHLFEHVYDPVLFMNHISSISKEDSYLIFSIPNLSAMLKNKYNNCLNFEHTIFITEPYVEYLLSLNNFKLIEKQYYKDDHSIFYCYKHSLISDKINIDNFYEQNKKLYIDYVSYNKNEVYNINKFISNKKNIYLFGAHIFSQSLINFGLDISNIVSIIDNDTKKQKLRLYGTPLKVESPQTLKGVENPIVILRAGIYNNEIKTDILQNINHTTKFI